MAATVQLVTFRLGKEEFGVPIGAIQEVVRLPEITPVPEAPLFVEGVINLRGRILPVLDLGRRLRLPERPRTRGTRVLVAQTDGRLVGLIVDAVSEVVRLPEAAIEPPPPLVGAIGADYVTGVGKLRGRLIVLLDLAKALDPAELRAGDGAGPTPDVAGAGTAALGAAA